MSLDLILKSVKEKEIKEHNGFFPERYKISLQNLEV